MEHIIDKVDKLAAELRKLLPMKSEYQQKLDKKMRLEFNYNSNHIEGNTLTYGETELLLIFDKTVGHHELREYEEMKAHDVVFELIKDWAQDKERPLTETAIRNLHEKLLVRPFYKEAITPDGQPTRRLIEIGNYKKHPNTVRLQNGEIFHYTSPEETPLQMGELIDWYRSEENGLHTVTLAAMLHYKFVRIHPFDDGNGRLSRLLMNYVLLKNNLPPVVIKSADKKNYLFALNQADIGDYAPFIEYIAQQLVNSLTLSIKAAKGEPIEEPDDFDKKLHILEKELEAVDPEKEIKQIYSHEVFWSAMNGWIKDLLIEVISPIQKFNKLFINTRHNISVQNGAYIQFVNEPAAEIVNNFIAENDLARDRIRNSEANIRFQAFYGTIKKGGLNPFGCNYGFEIVFQHAKYEVLVDQFVEDGKQRQQVKLHEKLLHQSLSEKEIKYIVELLRTAIYDHIDFNTRKSGLR
jgi:Fic family protein